MSLLVAPRAFAALTVTFSESVVDKVITAKDLEGMSFFDLRTTNSGSFKAVWTIPGLNSTNVTTNSVLSISLGGWSFFATLGQANIRTSTSWTFIQTAYDPASGRDVETGRILATRSGTVVTITGTAKRLDSSFVAGDYVGIPGAVQGQALAALELGTNSIERTVFYKGTSTTTNRVFGTNASAVEFTLNNVQITGSTDDVRPTISITSPKTGAQWSNNLVTVSGTATDNVGVSGVLAKVNDGQWVAAGVMPSSSNAWSIDVALAPGTNFVRAFSMDLDGGMSLTSVVQVLYVFPLALAIDPATGGTVTGISNQQMLVPNATYKATATPRAGYLFNGWSGDILASNRVLGFVMQPDRMLQANFVPDPYPGLKGVYNGLFFGTPKPDWTNSGFVTLTLADPGPFSGKLMMEGKTFPFTGSFNATGLARVVVLRGTNTPLALSMKLNLEDISGYFGLIQGTVSNQTWTANLKLERAFSSWTTWPLSHIRPLFATNGLMTLWVLHSDNTNASPGGDGAVTLSIDPHAVIKMTGTLADGSPVSQSVAGTMEVNSFGVRLTWPLYVPLYGGRGALMAWEVFVYNHVSADVDSSQVLYSKAPRPGDRYLPQGFRGTENDGVAVFGFQYFAPTNATEPIVNWTERCPLPDFSPEQCPRTGFLLLGGGNLPNPLTNRVMVVNSEARLVSWVSVGDFTNFPGLAARLTSRSDPVSAYLWGRFSTNTQGHLVGPDVMAITNVAAELNRIILGPSIYDATRFAGITLSPETVQLRSQNPQGAALNRLNRLLLEDAYPTNLVKVPSNPNNVSLVITPSTGAFSGSFTDPATHQVTPFKGTLLRGFQGGTFSGWFLGTNETGGLFMWSNLP